MPDLDLGAISHALKTSWRRQARPEQLAPEGDWFGWLILAGRGWGKTRTGAQWILEQKRAGVGLMGLVGATAADVRDVMIKGPAGILRCAPDHDRPDYQPSNRCLEWPNGAKALLFSAEEPDRLRGPELEAVWGDELAAWQNPEEAWEQITFVLRAGKPHAVVTTTPRPLPILRAMMKRADFIVTRGSSYDNQANLAPAYFANVIAPKEGTRLGRQEIHAEILDNTPGALWTLSAIEADRVAEAPDLVRIVVSIDPAVTTGADSDITGIVAAGIDSDHHAYVLRDVSGRYSPLEWAMKAIALYWELHADRILSETNQGGDLIEAALRSVDPNVAYKGIPAIKGKLERAEPVAAQYERHRVHHVGVFRELETEMTGYVPGKRKSPDRMDALVHGLAELMLGVSHTGFIDYMKAEVAKVNTPANVDRLRFIAAPGCSTLMLMDGTSVTPDADGIVTVPAGNASSLRALGWREAPPTIDGEVLP